MPQTIKAVLEEKRALAWCYQDLPNKGADDCKLWPNRLSQRQPLNRKFPVSQNDLIMNQRH